MRMISKLRLGIPLETARYLRPVVPEHERVCYCGSQQVETEVHVLFNCSVYDDLRVAWMKNLCVPDTFNELALDKKLKIVLNIQENVKYTAKFIISLIDLRVLKIRITNT